MGKEVWSLAESRSRKTMDYDAVTGGILKASLRIVAVLGIVILLYVCVGKSYALGYRIFQNKPYHPGSARSISVTIPDGCSNLEVAEALEKADIVENAYIFAIQCRIYHDRIKPGVHVISDAMTPKEILHILSEETEEQESEGSVPDGGNA